MNILITICARGGSKGIPGKNIKKIAGKSRIEYNINVDKQGKEKYDNKIAYSTDSVDIRLIVVNLSIISEYISSNTLSIDFTGRIDNNKDRLFCVEDLIIKK